jgi:hypothetical protein
VNYFFSIARHRLDNGASLTNNGKCLSVPAHPRII